MSKLSKHKDALADHPVDWKSHEYDSSLVFTMPHGLETYIEVTERKGVYSISLASTPWGTNKCLIENLKPEWVLPYTSGGERFHEAVKALWQKYKKPRARWTGHVIKVDEKQFQEALTDSADLLLGAIGCIGAEQEAYHFFNSRETGK